MVNKIDGWMEWWMRWMDETVDEMDGWNDG